ncbi:MAG: phosphotransferase family protein [Actinomycetes bacterium]
MPTPIAPDDIVLDFEEAKANEREPLVVLEPLAEFLDGAGFEPGGGLPELEPVGDGHSNITYLLKRGARDAVLRRPPRGPLPPTAHDMMREATLLKALEPTIARTPAVFAACPDATVIGAPFYLMEKVEGEVIVSEVPPALDSPEKRRVIGEELVDALVEFHSVDWQAAGLEGFGKPTGYLERQVKRFTGLWEINKTREIDAVEKVGNWLAANMPESGPATIVHGDYRLGNTMYAHGDQPELVAIFDWEMATIGDPLADLGYLCTLWSDHDDPDRGMFELSAVTRAEGFPTRAELVARYEEKSGREMGNFTWYATLAIWKAVVFMEGNYKRASSGASDDEFIRGFGDGVIELAERALALTEGRVDV